MISVRSSFGRYRLILAVGVCFFLINLPLLYYTLDKNKSVQQSLATYKKPEHGFITCKVNDSTALKALAKVKTSECKNQIIDTHCKSVQGSLYPKRLERTCNLDDKINRGRVVGCVEDDPADRLLSLSVFQLNLINSINLCIDKCILIGGDLAGVQYGYECFCGRISDLTFINENLIDKSDCDQKVCPGNRSQFCGGFKKMMVYRTGLTGRHVHLASYVTPSKTTHKHSPIRILFLLQLAGRGVRQVKRLLKLIYTPHHFYLIHVDARNTFMYMHMLEVMRILKVQGQSNLALTTSRFSSMWGGSSLNTMILSSIREALVLWTDWNYILNLSESDMPLLSIIELEAFVAKYAGFNMLKSHGNNTKSFIAKQGLERMFVECDEHMWRIGERRLPGGIRVDGGSDWICISRQFAGYAANSNEPLPKQLRALFETTLLPAESFFHTLLVNSEYCDTLLATNLKLINWHRRQGCKCQYKHLVDWCGCSPSIFLAPDELRQISREQAVKKAFYFARKFDPMIDLAPIEYVETENLQMGKYNKYTEHSSYKKYWQCEFDSRFEQKSGAHLNFMYSLARISVKSSVLHNCPNCIVESITNLHVLKTQRNVVHILVRFKFVCSESTFYEVESLIYRNLSRWTPFLLKDLSLKSVKLVGVAVGSQFDQKELVFREYLGVLSESSDPSVRHEWSYEESYNPNNKSNAKKVTISWIDPEGTVVKVVSDDLLDPKGDPRHVYNLNLQPSSPLSPGIWKVKLNLLKVIGVASFPVYPSGGDEIARVVADELSAHFYTFPQSTGICVGDSYGKYCGDYIKKVGSCAETPWSSFFPDPKSDISQGFHRDKGVLV